jgi:hypothetical protein
MSALPRKALEAWESGLSQTEPLILSRPFSRRIAQIGNADAAGKPTFHRGLDQARSDEGHRDRHVDMTNAAFAACSDFLDGLNAGDDGIQPCTATGNSVPVGALGRIEAAVSAAKNPVPGRRRSAK